MANLTLGFIALFYTQHLAPLKISKDPLLEEPEEIIQQEKTDDSEENEEETGTAG